MGEVLAPKRQTVVDRLRRRFDHYRRHHSSCVPRYEQGADFLAEKNRQDTVVLKQRYLESKAKKSKTGKSSSSNEHHKHMAVKEPVSDQQKVVSHSKAPKRHLENSPIVIQMPPDSSTDDVERSAKIAKSCTSEPNSSSESQQLHKKAHSTSSLLSQQQQFPDNSLSDGSANCLPSDRKSNNTQLLEGCSVPAVEVKDSLKPHTEVKPVLSVTKKQSKKSATITSQCSSEAAAGCSRVSNVVECKQEKEQEDDPVLCQFQGITVDYSDSLSQQDYQDHFSDTFPSLGGFTEDSDDDIRLDILNDLIDDVFSSSANIVSDFEDFEDNVANVKIVDEEEICRNDALIRSLNLRLLAEANQLAFSDNPQTLLQQPTGLFDHSSSALGSMPMSPSTITSASGSAAVDYVSLHQHDLSPFGPPPPLQPLPDNMSLDFKLTEPSPAALTLKQMAEQHQNMQQKHHLGTLDTSNRTAFNVDSFPDSMSFSFRNRFPPNRNYSTSKSSNSPVGLFNSVGLNSSIPYPGVEPISAFKRDPCSDRQAQNQQRQLMIPGTDCTDQKPPPLYNTSTTLGWPLDVIDHSNIASHHMSNQYLSANNGSQISENRALGIGYETRNVQQVHVDPGVKHQESFRQPYSNVYNSYMPQQHISNSVFSTPVSQNMSYNPQFTSAIDHLPLEYKMSQANTISVEEQIPLQTSTAYQQPFMGHQHTHRENVTHEWSRAQLARNGLNIDGYQQHDGYVQLSPANNQIPSTSIHQNAHHPYRAVEHYRASLTHLSHDSHPMMLHSQQMKAQFQQRQPLQVQHRLHTPVQALRAEAAASANATNASMYNVSQDGSQINLDFFDSIASNAPELLSFDQVLHNETATSFPLLDEMEMLNK